MLSLLLVSCSANRDGDRSSGAPTTDVTFPKTLGTTPQVLTKGAAEKAAPRWEQRTTFSGTGRLESAPFTISEGSIQWRVRWSCESARLDINVVPPPRKGGPLVSTPCPQQGEAFGIQTGELRLVVGATGAWTATVEQQVDTPINEPPLPGMDTAPVLIKGSFRNIDKTGKGTVQLYRLPDGQRALRFSDDFQVFNDTNLVVWLSEVADPRTSAEVVEAPHVEIAPLKSTRGPQNYIVPPSVPPERIRSVALYCVPVPSIYIAAPLAP